MRAAIYMCVGASDARQDTENQIRELRQFAGLQQWEVVDEYIDQESGDSAGPPQFRRMLADAAKSRFNVLLFLALERLTSEGALQTIQYLNRLTSLGVAFRSCREPYLDSRGGFSDPVAAILRTIAGQERVRISERVRAGLNRVRVNGSRSGRPVGRPRAIFRREDAITLRNSGLSWRQIASRLRVGMTTVRRACVGACNPCQNPQGDVL